MQCRSISAFLMICTFGSVDLIKYKIYRYTCIFLPFCEKREQVSDFPIASLEEKNPAKMDSAL